MTPQTNEHHRNRAASRGLELRYNDARDNPLHPGRGFMSSWDLVINPYVNCEFGCGYCYAQNLRPDDEPDEQWGQWVQAKSGAADALEARLYGARGNAAALDGATISIGTATDAYQPVEKALGITRRLLSALAGRPASQPAPLLGAPTPRVCVQTRSPLVCRDADLLLAIAKNGGRAQVNMTVTTDSSEVRRRIEPRCMETAGRLAAVTSLSGQGVETCVTVSPFLAVDQPDEFARRLAGSGASRFVIQELHPTGLAAYRAASRPGTDQLIAEIHRERGTEYRDEYRRFRDELRRAVTDAGLTWMGEGRNGFRPPW